ncbi:MAG: DNA-directed RNA polymerase subunit L [Candidatus Aenigmarchaeota archaeon]|nr:DNA-directed RNA polymerase subunit L [Candidatus Aenigmarchaeota archaeon]
MELKKLEDTGKRLIAEFGEETIAFANMVKDKLWEDPSVKEAATIMEHPYLSKPKILVDVSRGSPQAALEKAAEKLSDEAKEFADKFKDALKK